MRVDKPATAEAQSIAGAKAARQQAAAEASKQRRDEKRLEETARKTAEKKPIEIVFTQSGSLGLKLNATDTGRASVVRLNRGTQSLDHPSKELKVAMKLTMFYYEIHRLALFLTESGRF